MNRNMKRILLYSLCLFTFACTLKADSTMMPSDSKMAGMIRLYERFDSLYPKDTLVPEYLFKAADLAQGFHHEQLAFKYFDRILTDFPQSRKAAAALFMKAFLYDYNLGDKEQAKLLYSEFLEKYPGHQLAASAQASLDQLNAGLSDEEMVKLFQQRLDSTTGNTE
jgi:outer membrane protein assembly factor BamD (BamD/ComL family)